MASTLVTGRDRCTPVGSGAGPERWGEREGGGGLVEMIHRTRTASKIFQSGTAMGMEASDSHPSHTRTPTHQHTPTLKHTRTTTHTHTHVATYEQRYNGKLLSYNVFSFFLLCYSDRGTETLKIYCQLTVSAFKFIL